MSEAAFDTSTEGFQRDVLDASGEVPIVVDFWAPWCGPCRVLKPILEKVAAEYQGKFKLAKLNTDEHPEIAGRFGVRGIPNVKAFVDGKVVNEFTGALPESAVRQFVETIVPSPARQLQKAAREDVRAGAFDAAEAKLRQAIALDPQLSPARVDLAELLLARQDLEAAAVEMALVPAGERDDRASQLAAKIEFAQRSRSLPDPVVLREAVRAAPDDLGRRASLADRLVAAGDYRGALEEFLEVIARDRGEWRERARKGMVEVFNLAADRPDLVAEYRRKLAARLH